MIKAIYSLFSVLVLLAAHVGAFAPLLDRRTGVTQSSSNRFQSKNVLLASNGEEVVEVDISRGIAMRKAGAAMLASFAVVTIGGTDAALADIYDDQEAEKRKKRKEDSENGAKLVPTILIGGTLLTVPFFLPNLIRLVTKVGSGGKDDGYGK